MDEYLLTEFSIFYKRIMRVESYLKNLIIQKYTFYYGENAYNIVHRYIKAIQPKRNDKDKTFDKIHNSNLTNEEKITQAINKLYLSELLNFFSNPVFLKNRRIKNNFFNEEIQTNNTTFQQKSKNLKDFRNCIAHCNIKKYSLERNKFIKGLAYFERILNCNVILSCEILDKISNSSKLSVNQILAYIYSTDPQYFKDDKLLILLFDDIALINGYSFKSLPQRKTIIREHFKLLEKFKKNSPLEAGSQNSQMKLF